MKGPKTLLSEGITAVLDEFFEVDPDAIEAKLLGNDTQVVLRNTKLKPHTAELIKSDQQVVTSFTCGSVEEVLFTWSWCAFGQKYLVKDANLSVRGLRFKTQLSSSSIDEHADFERTPSGRVVPKRRRSSLAEIKKEGLVEAYIREQVEHIIDALTLAVEDFEFRIELPPNESGEVSGVTASGNSVELKSVGGALGDESRLRHRASFVNGGLRQQLSFGSICFGIVKTKLSENGESIVTETLPLLEPLSYILSATRFTGERFSGISSGLKVVGFPVLSSRNDIEATDVVLHAGLSQIRVLIDLGNLVLQKKKAATAGKSSHMTPSMCREEGDLSRDEGILETLVEESEQGCGEEEDCVECDADGTVWYPSLTTEEWNEIQQDYSYEEEAEKLSGDIDGVQTEEQQNGDRTTGQQNGDMYETLIREVKKSSIYEFPISGVSVILPNDAKLTLEALCIDYRADGTVMRLVGEHGAGILIDGFQLVNTKSGYDGCSRSRWVVDLITSQFSIEEESTEGRLPSADVAQIRWTERKLDRLIKGWVKLLECIKDLNLEKNPEMEFGGAVSNGFSVSFGTSMNR